MTSICQIKLKLNLAAEKCFKSIYNLQLNLIMFHVFG